MSNTIIVLGNIGQMQELKYTPNGQPVVEFSVADNLPKDKEGNERTQWYNCHAYGRVAELIAEYFSKGKPIIVSGRLMSRIYTRRDGAAGFSLDVQVSAFDFVNVGGSGNSERKPADPVEPTPPAPRNQPAGDDDMPDITDPFADQ